MPTEGRTSRWWLAIAAVAIGVAIVATQSLAFSFLTGRPMAFAGDVEPVQVTLVAFPFLILALLGARRWLPWLVGLVITVALWGWVLFEGVRYQWNPDGSGANIGLGLIMLASPLVITALCVLAHVAQAGSVDRR